MVKKDKATTVEINYKQNKVYSKTSIHPELEIDLEAEKWAESKEEKSSG